MILCCSSDTVSRSGVYCAVNNALEQCKAEGELDIFQSTKAIRMHKPGAVTTLVSKHLDIGGKILVISISLVS